MRKNTNEFELFDVKATGVDLVEDPAIRRPFLIMKSMDGGVRIEENCARSVPPGREVAKNMEQHDGPFGGAVEIQQKREVKKHMTTKTQQHSTPAFAFPDGGSDNGGGKTTTASNGSPGPIVGAVRKSLNEISDTGGAVLLTEEVSSDIIALVSQQSPYRKLGARIMPMRGPSLRIPKIKTGASAKYVSSGDKVDLSELATGGVNLFARDLTAAAPIDNDLLEDVAAAETIVRDDLARALAEKETTAFTFGPGGVEPLGLMEWADLEILDPVAVGSLAVEDLRGMVKNVQARGYNPTGFAMTPSLGNEIALLKDGDDRFIWANAIGMGDVDKLFGRAVAQSLQLADPDTASTHYIVCGAFAEMVIGERKSIEISATRDLLFLERQTVVMAVARHDMVLRRVDGFCVLPVTGVS